MLAHPTTSAKLEQPGSASSTLPIEIEPSVADQFLNDGDTVTLGSHTFDVWFVPGHDPGHIVLVSVPDEMVLGGDVLFPGGHGTIEIPGADANQMRQALSRLAGLPDGVTVYPGHGLPTTIGQERGWLPSRFVIWAREYRELGRAVSFGFARISRVVAQRRRALLDRRPPRCGVPAQSCPRASSFARDRSTSLAIADFALDLSGKPEEDLTLGSRVPIANPAYG